MQDVLVIDNVEFSYYDKKILKGITFKIPEGRIFGFLGPNGAGKTTTIRLINGLLELESGNIKVFDRDVYKNISFVHSISGVLTETASLYKNLSGKDNILFFASLRGLPKNILESNLNWISNRLELSYFWDKKVKDMSTGMRKRIAIAIALIHKPSILFLDEPTSGLDPETTYMVKELMREFVTEIGSTIFLCTHFLKEAEEICDLFGLIREGRLLAFGTLEELIKKFPYSLYLKIKGIKPENIDLKIEEVDKNTFHLYIDDLSNINEYTSYCITKWINSGGKIYEAKIEHWNLEKIYFSF
ncbi:MAG: ABC transporter ATP-binding protein [Brevinematales bacterium]|nr:ABC transporter ATP-binding protein [Brevinematales bacterium]